MVDINERIAQLSPEKRAMLAKKLQSKRAPGSKLVQSKRSTPLIEPRPRDGDSAHQPQSFSQERFWFLQQWAPESSFYNDFQAYRLSGDLDIGVLASALTEIARRHEVLRAVFIQEGDRPVQSLASHDSINLRIVDLAALPKPVIEEEVEARVRLEFEHTFDLAVGPMFRILLIQLGRREWVLAFTMHHIVTDGRSWEILLHELASLYEVFSEGKESPLPSLPFQFVDFAHWQHEQFRQGAWDEQLDYWRRQLEGAAPLLALPTDRPRGDIQNLEGAQIVVDLGTRASAAITAFAQRQGVTPFMILLSGFKALLARYSAQQDILVGTPIAGRVQQGTDRLIGPFLNTIVLRVNLGGNPWFRELVDRVRSTAVAAYANQDLPFEKLVAAIEPERTLRHAPLFQVIFDFQEATGAMFQFKGLQLESLNVESHTTLTDIQFKMADDGDRFRGTLYYSCALFDPTTIRRLVGSFEQILEAATAEPSTPLGDLPLLSRAQHHELITEWNDSARRPSAAPALLHQRFERSAQERPDAVAVVAGEVHRSYGEIHRSSSLLAQHLASEGVGRGSWVGVYLDRSAEMIVALLGILRAGAVYVPLGTRNPEERIRWILETMEIGAVVSSGSRLAMLAGLWPTLPGLRHVVALGSPSPATCPPPESRRWAWLSPTELEPREVESGVGPEDMAYVIFTSGSTGRPKGVMVRHRPAVNLVDWVNRTFEMSSEDRGLFITSLSFDLSVYDIFGVLAAGGTVRVALTKEVEEPQILAEILEREAITFWDSAPAALQVVAPYFSPAPAGDAGRALRLVFLSGDWIPLALPERIRSSFPNAQVIALGGATEATVWSNFFPVREIEAHWVSIPYGRPIQNARYHVLEPSLGPCPIGVAGDLFIGGGCLASGYARAPSLTAWQLIPDPLSGHAGAVMYRTGDRARYLADGNIEFLGRLDHQVKIRGFRIELGEIESALQDHPDIQDPVVAVRKSPAGDQQLVAYALTAGTPPSPESLKEFLESRLPAYMVPSTFLFVDALPLSANGKLDRGALPDPDWVAMKREYAAPSTAVEEKVEEIWKELLGVEKIGVHDSFFDLGGHSLLAAQMHSRIREELEVDIRLVEVFQYPTIQDLAEHLEQRQGSTVVPELATRATLRTRPVEAGAPRDGEIALIGMAGRFPGARDIEAFWRLLCDGVEGIARFDEDELLEAGTDAATLQLETFVPASGYLADADRFDASFFGYTPREAQIIDPQQRIFLEAAYAALEDAGYGREDGRGAVGVFAGASLNQYLSNVISDLELMAVMGGYQVVISNDKDYLASRVSYKLNLRGPSVAVQTACSTSLVAVHMACQSLLDGECDMALAGGVSVGGPLRRGYIYEEGGILAPDGHCRSFDANSGGTVDGDGVGVVVLKKLSAALRDGDPVYAVIKGTAINNDGAGKIGFTAPSVEGQAAVIAEAQEMAGVEPETIGFIEAHGTGTRLGDPIEVTALTRAFRRQTPKRGFCALGAVKSNIGHLDAGAGVAGLIKASLAVCHGKIPPNLHFEAPNPEIDFAASPFYVPAKLQDWPAGEGPRRAGVSSFGIGGTNAHAVLEQAPAPAVEAPPAGRSSRLLVLSAKSADALDRRSAQLADHLRARPELDPDAVTFTLQAGRERFSHRRALIFEDLEGAVQKLDDGATLDLVSEVSEARVAFLFPGQGAQYPGMGRGLYESEEVFRHELDRCAELLAPHLDRDLLEVLYPPDPASEAAAGILRQTAWAQPALFAVEYALARLWMSWGVRPWAMLGHSIGEYVAACLAGVFTLEDSLALVATRGRWMQELPAGAMLAIPSPLQDLEDQLDGTVCVAAVNAPRLTVVSGPEGEIEALARRLAEGGVEARTLHTSHAFHSAMMDPILDTFTEKVASMGPQEPSMPFVSNLTGTWIEPSQATDPAYWARHLRETVRFADGLELLAEHSRTVLLEVGPGRNLGKLARQTVAACSVAASLPGPGDTDADQTALLKGTALLWLAGAELDWRAFHGGPRRRVHLPTYPFDGPKYWVEPVQGAAPVRSFGKLPLEEWTYLPSWTRHRIPSLPASLDDDAGWLILADRGGLGGAVYEALCRWGQEVTFVEPGPGFERLAGQRYQLDPCSADDLGRLLEEVAGERGGSLPARIVHLLNVDPLAADIDQEGAPRASFQSLVALVQAIDLRPPEERPAIELLVVSRELQEVVPGDGVVAEKSALLGLLKVIEQELAYVRCRSLDLEGGEAAGPRDGHLAGAAEAVLAEMASRSEDRFVALRGPFRWSRTFEQVPWSIPEQMPWRQEGVYLITGGLGNLGQLFARVLFESAGARLVLTGRSAIPPRQEWDEWLETHTPDDLIYQRLRFLLDLEAQGAEILTIQADVVDRDQMERAVREAEDRFGAVNGVLHTAGMGGLTLIQQVDLEGAREIFAAKVRGARVLSELFRDRELDFLVLFSSISSTAGGLGLAAYSSANACLDGTALANRIRGGPPTVAVGWGLWQQPGVDESAPQIGARLREQMEMAIHPDEGTEILQRILADPLPQVVVSPRDLFLEMRAVEELRGEQGGGGSLTLQSRPPLETPYVAPRDEIEEALVAIWQELIGVEGIGVDDNFYELGGHSLLAMQVISRTREALSVDLSLDQMLVGPTVAGLAAVVTEIQAEQIGEDAALVEMMAEVQGVSADELRGLLET